jgi:hypothetical protein
VAFSWVFAGNGYLKKSIFGNILPLKKPVDKTKYSYQLK